MDINHPRYGEEFWLRLLLRVRIAETRLTDNFSKSHFNSVIKKATLASQYYNIEKALNVINNAIKSRNLALQNPNFSRFLLDKGSQLDVSLAEGKSLMQTFEQQRSSGVYD